MVDWHKYGMYTTIENFSHSLTEEQIKLLLEAENNTIVELQKPYGTLKVLINDSSPETFY